MRGAEKNSLFWVGLILFSAPYGIVAALMFGFIAQGYVTVLGAGVFWLLCFGAIFTLVTGSLAKYPVLVVSLLVWFGLIVGLAVPFVPNWPVLALVGIAMGTIGLTVLAARIGLVWGWGRAVALASRGRGTIGWEWVYVGPEFARSHPAAARFGAVWLVIAWVALLAAGYTLAAVADDFWRFGWTWWIAAMFAELTFVALLLRWPVAYGMTLILLGVSLPFSFPLLIYWADGVRPNLVYRWRFERLRQEVGP
ncbi:hypothetical protein [Actibacterium sp. 188UL27-1]|uniref:hypothetical protein n=1 Tax=Actibacterium sp. 188UL27-1 TaxID=2786961 RepID=UPI00195AB106|nr:hypothetical protein [Actibacterium sp. 188UL27-1]MBM7067775.1 hypothetical protein [Actibacterium sp. 188UL27-1]